MKKDTIVYPIVLMLLAACASMATPDGGPYDEDPPIFLSSEPVANALHVTEKKIVLNFNENIKLENAFERVMISPPQKEMPEIKSSGKRVTVELFDTLQPNTTYSIDFGDAIVDNNESNPLENFAFVFSTGDKVDTLAVSGTVLNAEDLEPIKGMLVGLYKVGDDSAFYKRPFERVSRTDSRGRFIIKGLAPGKYRIYALADANQNYFFDQKSEKIAFLDRLIEPTAIPAMRSDTIWRDSLTIDTIREVPYIRFMPDDLVLRAFNETFYSQYLKKSQRLEHRQFSLFFADENDSLPKVKGLNFNEEDAFIIEASEKMDTINFWLKDTTVYYMDTLALSVTYKVPDSLGAKVPRTDTVYVSPRKSRAKILEAEKEVFEKEKKDFLKKAKKSENYDEENPPVYVPPVQHLKVNSRNLSTMDLNIPYRIYFDEPLASIDTTHIHVKKAVNDSVYEDIPYVFRKSDNAHREYVIYAEWRPEESYMVTIDSAAFRGLYGRTSDKFEEKIKFRSLDDYAVLLLTIPGTGNKALVQLLKSDGSVLSSQRTENNQCSFYFIKPGKYYLRLLMDDNGNGKWDTGDYGRQIAPEHVYYYPHLLELKALFEYAQDDWDINAPLNEQKPLSITKQKPDKERKKRNRNADRKFKSK